MCNPRRVNIQLSRSVEEAWRQTVERTANVRGEVSEMASIPIAIHLDDEMGELALQMLSRVIAEGFSGFPEWQQDDDGNYYHELDGVTLVFNPQTYQITMNALLSEEILGEARAAATASGVTVGDLTVEAIGRYYDDNWGGRTEEHAKQEAGRDAEMRMRQAILNLEKEQHAEKLKAAEDEAQEKAEIAARESLEQSQEEVREVIRVRLQSILAEAQEAAFFVMNRAIGEAYRQTLQQLVLENGGNILLDEETGSMIRMEIEL